MDEEKRLILDIQKNQSRIASDILVRAYYKEIYIYVYRQLNNKEDSMDTTQEIFISMLKSINSYNFEISSFRTWLYTIATNKVIDFRRKFKSISLSIDELEISDSLDNELIYENLDLLEKIENYVSDFDKNTQIIFRMHIYDGRTFKEIGNILDESEGTVKSRFYRLQKKIKEEFKDYERF